MKPSTDPRSPLNEGVRKAGAVFDWSVVMPEQPAAHNDKKKEYKKYVMCCAITITLGVATGLTGFFVFEQSSFKPAIASGHHLDKAFVPSVQARQSFRSSGAATSPIETNVYHTAPQRPQRITEVLMGRKGRPQMPTRKTGAMDRARPQVQKPELPADGTPIFYLFCRDEPASRWYPVSAMKGDTQSKVLVTTWLNAPFMNSVVKNRLDGSLAASIYDSERRLTNMAKAQYRVLKDAKEFEWAYKPMSIDIEAKVEKGDMEKVGITAVNRGMIKQQGLLQKAQEAASKPLDSIKNMFGGNKETK